MAQTLESLLNVMEFLGPAGQRHVLFEADAVFSCNRFCHSVMCQGVQGDGPDEASAIADWKRMARAEVTGIAA